MVLIAASMAEKAKARENQSKSALSFEMALWILAAMQDADYLNPVGGYTIKQGVAFDRYASRVM